MNKQIQTFSFCPPSNLIEEGKWLLGVTSFEATKSVFKKTGLQKQMKKQQKNGIF